ncbi:unnamed protein product [Didymodactylos carnosus]|uniref:Uncharacterized protein n=1 Tax=Didymodactylos carnosus TaxID=1234261 RepID=A0A8S2IGI5_9BILA|nr:unnamed protein product [Didymodactylos carnosus]CAF3738644.1 unnamed protein product [Didymodactylos carnosus]
MKQKENENIKTQNYLQLSLNALQQLIQQTRQEFEEQQTLLEQEQLEKGRYEQHLENLRQQVEEMENEMNEITKEIERLNEEKQQLELKIEDLQKEQLKKLQAAIQSKILVLTREPLEVINRFLIDI